MDQLNVFFVRWIFLGFFWVALTRLCTGLKFTVFWDNFLATEKIKTVDLFRLISWLAVFYEVLNFFSWSLLWLILVIRRFSTNLTNKVFEVAIDVNFAWFRGVWLCGCGGLLFMPEKGFWLNVAKYFDKILFRLTFTGL